MESASSLTSGRAVENGTQQEEGVATTTQQSNTSSSVPDADTQRSATTAVVDPYATESGSESEEEDSAPPPPPRLQMSATRFNARKPALRQSRKVHIVADDATSAKARAKLELACFAQTGRWARHKFVLGLAARAVGGRVEVELAAHDDDFVFRVGFPHLNKILTSRRVLKVGTKDAFDFIHQRLDVVVWPTLDVLDLAQADSIEVAVDATLDASLSNASVAYAAFRIFAALQKRASADSDAPSDNKRPSSSPPRAPISDKKHKTTPPAKHRPHLVAALETARKLQPSKQAVYDMFFVRKLTIDEICAERGNKKSTVLGYLTEAITAGHAYDWSVLEPLIPDSDLILRASQDDGASLGSLKKQLPGAEWWQLHLIRAHRVRVAAAAATAATTPKPHDSPPASPHGEVGEIKVFFV
ncbi:hypothetical protein CTAYLR_004061 [Chrysophaeum taylorii]|uniref:Helicase Helix-turn-helix domain-containing protein n=1 Tax=Chrysophaeum taylorii TaxID=2483200 RepID=A0AAD7UMQ7_9STRA|nr:hypothetical protein CTAYLR_004061 [Chrysophaeum taylorii]